MKTVKIELKTKEVVDLDKYDLSRLFKEVVEEQVDIKSIYVNLIKEEIAKQILAESKKYKKQIATNVKLWIQSMSSTELFYRDEFREMLVDSASNNSKKIEKRVVEIIDSMPADKISDSISYRLGNDFYNFIKNKED